MIAGCARMRRLEHHVKSAWDIAESPTASSITEYFTGSIFAALLTGTNKVFVRFANQIFI
jgi:hypothetical protein